MEGSRGASGSWQGASKTVRAGCMLYKIFWRYYKNGGGVVISTLKENLL